MTGMGSGSRPDAQIAARTPWMCECGHYNGYFASACYGGCGKDRPADVQPCGEIPTSDAAKGYRRLTPRELAKRRCRARIDGRHEWVYVGGGKYRCAGCGAE